MCKFYESAWNQKCETLLFEAAQWIFHLKDNSLNTMCTNKWGKISPGGVLMAYSFNKY